jgi:hypothetical protein
MRDHPKTVEEVMRIELKQGLEFLNENGVPIKYHTLYTWARFGVFVGDEPVTIATQIGNRWMVEQEKLQQIVDGVKNNERVKVQKYYKKKESATGTTDKAEKRGRPKKPTRKNRKRDVAAADRL